MKLNKFGPIAFRPVNHPLLHSQTSCPKCQLREHFISLPAYPGDYYDCENCGHSWAPTKEETAKMRRTK